MPEASSTGITDPGHDERPALGLGSRGLTVLIGVLAVVLVAAVVTAAVMGSKAHAADERAKARASAETVAAQFALRMDAVDGAQFDTYIKKVNELLTTKAKTKNSQQIDVMKQTYQAAKVKGTGKVLLTAVGDSDEDSATVLVIHDAAVDTAQGKLSHHYRWSVNMVKVKGSWLVDDFNPVS